MSHGRIVVLSNMELTQHERELAFEYLYEQLCPHKYDYMIWMTEHEDKPEEVNNFWSCYPELTHNGNNLTLDFGDAYMIERENEDFPYDKYEQANFLKAFYYFTWHTGLYEFAFVKKYGEDDIEVTHANTLLQGILETEVSMLNLRKGIHPSWCNDYEYILTDIYDYHY